MGLGERKKKEASEDQWLEGKKMDFFGKKRKEKRNSRGSQCG